MQVRPFSLVQKSSGEGGEPCGREVRVAQALDRARLAMKCAGHPQDPAVEPGAMNVVFTTPSAALAASLQSLSEGVQAMLSTHDPGGRLFVGPGTPMPANLLMIFQEGAVIAMEPPSTSRKPAS